MPSIPLVKREVWRLYAFSSWSYACLALALICSPLRSCYQGLFPPLVLLASLLLIQSLCSYQVDVVHFWRTCNMPAWQMKATETTLFWLQMDRSVAVLLGSLCSLNALHLPWRHALWLMGCGGFFLVLLYKSRQAAHSNRFYSHLCYHMLWHYVPPLVYGFYILTRSGF